MRKLRFRRRRPDPTGVVAALVAAACAAAIIVHAGAANANPTPPAALLCAPVTYSVDGALGPPTARRDVSEAMRELASLTGIPFVERGIADRVVLRISWVRPPADWRVATVGRGGAEWRSRGAIKFMRSGSVVLRAAGDAPSVSWPRAIRHELGHVMGLGHATNDRDVMFPTTTAADAAGWSDPERARLAARGRRAGCAPSPGAPIVGVASS